MKTTLYVPVLDTVTKNFDYDGELGTEEFSEMVYDNFQKTNRQIGRYVNNLGQDSEYKKVERSGGNYDIDTTGGDDYQLRPCEAYIADMNGDGVDATFFDTYMDNEKMCILIVDINPEKIDWDTSSELRFWVLESDRILKDNDVDDDTKLKMLPKTHFYVDVSDKRLKLNECKLIEMYNEKNHPYKFGILIKKITVA